MLIYYLNILHTYIIIIIILPIIIIKYSYSLILFLILYTLKLFNKYSKTLIFNYLNSHLSIGLFISLISIFIIYINLKH